MTCSVSASASRCASMMNQASLHNARVAASVVATLAMAPKVAVERAAAAAIPVDVLPAAPWRMH